MSLILCERYGTKMTAAACSKFRENTPQRCKGCPGPVDVGDGFAEVGRVIDIPKGEVMSEKKKSYKTVKPCAKCGRTMPLVSRGLCGGCRSQEVKAGTLDVNYPAGQNKAANKSKPVAVENKKIVSIKSLPTVADKEEKKSVVDEAVSKGAVIVLKATERDAELFAALQDWADDDRRTIHSQVLHILDKVVADRANGLAL